MSRLGTVIERIKSVWEKIKTSLRRQRWREVLIFCLFLSLSLGFWVLQSMNQEYEMELSVPVRYKDFPKDIVFKQSLPERVNVRVKDKGNVLLNYSLARNFRPIEITENNLNSTEKIVTVTQSEIESHLQKSLAVTTYVIDFSPSQLDVSYSQQFQKSVPITFKGFVNPRSGYGVSGEIVTSPSVVMIYTDKTRLDSIKSISTIYTEVRNVKSSVTQKIKLEEIEGVIFEPTEVSLTIPIEEFTEKTLEIPIVCVNVPVGYTVRTFPTTVMVRSSVPLSKYKDLSERGFTIDVEFADMEQSISGMLPLKLTTKPDWISTHTLIPDKFEFVLERRPVL
jgi:YbbR-like protein.